jgi:glucose-6-phosphate 1-dehydrogenase
LNDIDDIVIFGATGDLARRMLFPSLFSLERDSLLPEGLQIVGASRGGLDANAFITLVRVSLEERAGTIDEALWRRFSARLRYCKVNIDEPEDFASLELEVHRNGRKGSHLFFLSVSPDYYELICERLKGVRLNTPGSRIIVEKPIGHDLESCRSINSALAGAFEEGRIFRIDHYLGKETVQNILALRFANLFFESLWDRSHIEYIKITVFETVGVEGRWSYYDRYGALRDMIQNHVLQLLCLIALEPPAKLDPDAIRDEKVKVLRSLKPILGRDVLGKTVRGQYVAGTADAAPVLGYAQEAGGGTSDTETFVALEAQIENWRWAGVPFILQTGKRMGKRLTEIEVQFRSVPHSLFSAEENSDLIPNRLTITLQPEEHVSLGLMNKTPGLTSNRMNMSPLALNLSLTEAFHSYRRRIAYEQLLLDALAGNQTLFVRDDEVENAWKWVDGIVAGWKQFNMKPEPYKAGSQGPEGVHPLSRSFSLNRK